ncbi:hypothetical protein LZ32DRAFT_609872 [Colletotrichum eremochloae]|nr:hypothetical protein LY78DRAFT_656581 [Colletotrichum sublineola]KAK2007948.1 hypothetical protein LZ32DRAFT_609872 [Colletotrichum eremochloae]
MPCRARAFHRLAFLLGSVLGFWTELPWSSCVVCAGAKLALQGMLKLVTRRYSSLKTSPGLSQNCVVMGDPAVRVAPL